MYTHLHINIDGMRKRERDREYPQRAVAATAITPKTPPQIHGHEHDLCGLRHLRREPNHHLHERCLPPCTMRESFSLSLSIFPFLSIYLSL